jgi:hypothetical protein
MRRRPFLRMLLLLAAAGLWPSARPRPSRGRPRMRVRPFSPDLLRQPHDLAG